MDHLNRLTRTDIARLVAQDVPDGSYVNLGIGLPTLVAKHLPEDREIILHSENGILGMGPRDPSLAPDIDLVNASKEYVGLVTGASICDSATSFMMMRGGHLDLTVLGAFQVSARGDLANWQTDEADAIPGVGGAMDLAVGARRVFVMMEHTTKTGGHKIVDACSFPITARGVVDRVYTDLAVIDIEAGALTVRGMVDGLAFDRLQQLTGPSLRRSSECVILKPSNKQ
jgi:3-oxoadipate CoA-transferase beta subunit